MAQDHEFPSMVTKKESFHTIFCLWQALSHHWEMKTVMDDQLHKRIKEYRKFIEFCYYANRPKNDKPFSEIANLLYAFLLGQVVSLGDQYPTPLGEYLQFKYPSGLSIPIYNGEGKPVPLETGIDRELNPNHLINKNAVVNTKISVLQYGIAAGEELKDKYLHRREAKVAHFALTMGNGVSSFFLAKAVVLALFSVAPISWPIIAITGAALMMGLGLDLYVSYSAGVHSAVQGVDVKTKTLSTNLDSFYRQGLRPKLPEEEKRPEPAEEEKGQSQPSLRTK